MGEWASQAELVRRVADRLDLEPAMVMGRVVASTPATGGPGRKAAPARGADGRRPGARRVDRGQAAAGAPSS